jgi:hypothetical protein
MNSGRAVFAGLIEHLPHKEFNKWLDTFRGDLYAKHFFCWDQSLAMAFAQLTYRESLRDIETCLGAVGDKLYHMGFRTNVARFDSRRWQRITRLAHLCLLRADADCTCTRTALRNFIEAQHEYVHDDAIAPSRKTRLLLDTAIQLSIAEGTFRFSLERVGRFVWRGTMLSARRLRRTARIC